MKNLHLLCICALLLTVNSCYYDNAAEMYPAANLNTECDTTGTITYNQHIKTIFDGSCGAQNSCHSSALANGGIVLETYTLASQVDSATLIGCVEQTAGYAPMPPGTTISDCAITQIKKWVEQGKPE